MTTILKTGEIQLTKRSTLQRLFDVRSDLQRDLDRVQKALRAEHGNTAQHKLHAQMHLLLGKLRSQDKKIQAFLRAQSR